MALVHRSFVCCENVNKRYSFGNTGLPVEGKLTLFSFKFLFIYLTDKMFCVYIGLVLSLKHFTVYLPHHMKWYHEITVPSPYTATEKEIQKGHYHELQVPWRASWQHILLSFSSISEQFKRVTKCQLFKQVCNSSIIWVLCHHFWPFICSPQMVFNSSLREFNIL